MTRWTAAPVLVVALLGLAACSSAATPATVPPASSATAASTPPPTSTASTSNATGIPASTSTTGSAPAPAGGYPAAEVCAYLKGQIPVLTAIDSPVGREANLTANLFGFFGDHGIAPDGAQLESATAAECPDTRSQLLTLTGLTSLAQL